MTNNKNYVQLDDDKWYKFNRSDYLICCDCSLVHKLKFKIIDGKIFIKFIRDDRATSAYRRNHKIKKEIKELV